MTDDADPDDERPGRGTRSLHAGQEPDPATGARAPPLHQTTSYVFPSAAAAADRNTLDADGHVYSRISNPTVETLEERLAALHDAPGATATASGMAALDTLTSVLAAAGDNVVFSTDSYGGTLSYLSSMARRRGIETTTVPTTDYDAYAEAIDDDTAYVHVETIGNPSLVTPDFERLADVAGDHGVPLIVDNTFATPQLCRPLEHGADALWASTTKWLHGSGTTVGGVLVDGGSFPWEAHAEEYPELAAPHDSYDGTVFAEEFDAPLAAAARYRGVSSLGNAQSPFDAWQTIQGIETLPLRMDRHCENAAVVADYLRDHDDVAWVTYPGHEDHPTHDNATRYLDDFGGMVAFGLEGGFEAGRRFCEAVSLVSFLANIGDAKSLVIHPASTTHSSLSEAEQRAAGVTPDMLRFSVGIEDPADVLADVERAIATATEET